MKTLEEFANEAMPEGVSYTERLIAVDMSKRVVSKVLFAIARDMPFLEDPMLRSAHCIDARDFAKRLNDYVK